MRQIKCQRIGWQLIIKTDIKNLWNSSRHFKICVFITVIFSIFSKWPLALSGLNGLSAFPIRNPLSKNLQLVYSLTPTHSWIFCLGMKWFESLMINCGVTLQTMQYPCKTTLGLKLQTLWYCFIDCILKGSSTEKELNWIWSEQFMSLPGKKDTLETITNNRRHMA